MKHPTDKGLPAEGLPVCAAECAEHADGTTTTDLSCDSRQADHHEPPKSQGGAPLGNVNAAVDKDFARAMKALKAEAARGRQAHSRKAKSEADKIVAELGAAGTAIGERAARRMAERETLIGVCKARVQRAASSRKGDPSRWLELLVRLTDQDADDLATQLRDFKATQASRGGEVVVRIIDDIAADDGGKTITPEDLAAWEARSATPGSALGPRCEELTLAARLANREIALPDEAAIAARLQDLDEDPDDVSALRPPDGQRRPEKARRPDSTTPAPPTAAPSGAGPEAPPQKNLHEEANERCRRYFDSGGSFGALGSLYR